MRLGTFGRAALGAAAACLAAALPAAAATDRPNVAVIVTDDQETRLFHLMPNARRLVIEAGAEFRRAFFNDPLCCPSRATMLTGRYVQNTRVDDNSHALFHRSRPDGSPLEGQTLAVWMDARGYRTALIGKYLNGFPAPEGVGHVPPGWDTFAPSAGGEDRYFGHRMIEDGKAVAYGQGPEHYSTDVLGAKAVAFAARALDHGVPFFLWLSFNAPHLPATPAPRHAEALPEIYAPKPPSFNEADVSDKPAYVRHRRPFPASFVEVLDDSYRQRARSLVAVDEWIGRLLDALEGAGALDDTYVVLTSDNGWVHGQHRIAQAKGLPYEEAVRMPLFVRGPGVRAGAKVDRLASNADLAPTVAALAGARVRGDIDGRSLAPLLLGGDPPAAWRRAVPLFYREGTGGERQPGWRGLRTDGHAYVEYATGECELYDMRVDPYQLENLCARADPAFKARLSRRTAELAACKGARCRELEDAPL